MTCALVPLMPNEDTPARRGPAGLAATAPASVSSATAPADQSTCGVGSSTCRVARQHAVAHGHDHLDDAGDTGGGLGVADVGLERAQPQRPVLGPVLAVGGEQRLRLDRVAERGAGAVRLDRVDVGRRSEPRVGQRLPDDALLGGAVGRGQAVARAVLVDGAAADDGQDRVAVAPRVGEPLHERACRRPRPSRCRRRPPANGLQRPSGGERRAAG